MPLKDWREGIEDALEKAAEPLWSVAEEVLEAAGKIIYAAGAREEREAVVRWLRENEEFFYAEQIEAGEHRKDPSHA